MWHAGKKITIDYVHCDFCLFVPNAFSPNGDGNNDVFRVLQTCPISKYKIQVFNRWGQLVFVSYRVSDSWDGGIAKGDLLDMGTYFYNIEATVDNVSDNSKQDIHLKGDVLLIR